MGLYERFLGFLPPRTPARPFAEQGTAGFIVIGGVVRDNESNPKLLGENRWRTAADLLANISIIAASLRYTLNLMARPAWKVDPPNDSAEAKAAQEFVEEIIDDISTSWTRIVRRAAMYRFHGFGINEWTAKRRDDGKIGIDSVESRPQHTIERWDIDDNGGVQGVWQRDPLTSGYYYLPRAKLIYLVDDTLTDRPDGMGWFRHMVDPATRLKAFLKLEGIGFQRDLTGIPIGRAPLQKINKLVQDKKLTQEQATQMINGIKDFCRLEAKNEHTGLVLDSKTFEGKTADGGVTISQVAEWGMELLTGSQSSIQALGEAIRRTEFEMALIMGTQSILTGREGQGSRALSEDQSRNLYLTVNSTLDDMVEGFARDLIDPIWAMNGLDDALKPKLSHEDASFKDVAAIAKALSDMAAAGAILAPDDPAINDVRNLLGLSEAEPMDAEQLALLRNPTGEPGQAGGGGSGGGGAPPNPKGGQGRAAKYDPSEPRVPAGSEHGGEWTGDGGGAGEGGLAILTQRKFKNHYLQHIDIRGREDGTAQDNLAAIRRDGFKEGFGPNLQPVWTGGKPSNVIEERFVPQKGDVVYLVPPAGRVEGGNGARIKSGWKPAPGEAVVVERDGQSLYDLYSAARAKG